MMAKSGNLLDLYETHLHRESKVHRQSLQEIRDKLRQIKEFRKNRLSPLSDSKSTGSLIEPKEDSSDTEDISRSLQTLVAKASYMNLSDDSLSEVSEPDLHLVNVEQYFLCVESEESKSEAVCQLFKTQEIDSAVIYCNSTQNVEALAQIMESNGFNVKSLHKKKTKQKEKLIHQFMSELKPIQAIITVKRLENLSNVLFYINYDLPSRETYIKKIGSETINGFKYAVINIITKSQFKSIIGIEKYYTTKINPFPLRTENLLQINY